MDIAVRYMAYDNQVAVTAASTKHTVKQAADYHNLSPLCAVALGRLLTASALMATQLKNEKDILTILVNGDGEIGTMMACANAMLDVKGYVENPFLELPLKNGKFDVGGAVGKGTLTVLKDLGLKEPYSGTIELVSGELAEDLAYYYSVSEQQPSAVSLGVLANASGIQRAGGLLVQPLPYCSKDVIRDLENRSALLCAFPELLDSMEVQKAVELVFDDAKLDFSGSHAVRYHCDCSRERLNKVLVSLGEKELKEIIEEDGHAEITCRFCDMTYQFNAEELTSLLKDAK
ncbi:MAG: Hsp33 family molecular chaperone HslO [Christensenellales bacterium]